MKPDVASSVATPAEAQWVEAELIRSLMRTARTTPLLLVLSLVVTLGGCSGGPAPRAWAA